MAKGVEAVTVSASEVRTDDWPAQATEAIVNVVGTAHDKITGPIQTAARVIVYGLLAAMLATIAVVLLIILGVRVLDAYLPDAAFGEAHVWAAYLILGVLISGAGLYCVRRGRRPAEA
jgi:hypothetical protein